MAGYGLDQKHHLATILEKNLNLKGMDVKVINASVSGDTSAGGLNRINWILSEQKFDLFILGLGANDMLRGISPEETEKNLEKIIENVLDKNITLILAGMIAPTTHGAEYKNKFDIIFFEKARGSGGRMSSRRIDEMFFDQGASCFGAIRSEKFNNFIAPFLEKGIIKEWSGEFRILDGKTMQYSDLAKKKRLVCQIGRAHV